jgi:FkbM family methyltransferase
MRKKIKVLFFKIRFGLSSRFPRNYGWFYRLFYRPRQGSLSAYLNAYSQYRKGRVRVIQIGANDGITHDPIHKFIRSDNWSGVLLEPQKFVFDHFLAPLYAKTEGIKPINAAIGCEDGVMPIFNISFTNERWATGLTSFDKKTLQKMIDSGYVTKQALRSELKVPKDQNQWISHEMVDVICLSTLVKRYKLQDVNLIMIDAEGYDDQIIKMIDFDLIRPDVIVFEAMHLDDAPYESLCAYLEQYGYKVLRAGASSIALHQSVPL